MADGLTVPFALAAGLPGAMASSGFTGVPPWRGGFQTLLVGGLTAAAAFGIARLLG